MSEKTHWKKSFNSPYLGSWDLEENQVEITLTIKAANSEMTKDLKENTIKNVIYFEENYKPMIVNSGNSKVIKHLSGSNYLEDWIGTHITIYAKEIKAFGENHEALRIRSVTNFEDTLNDLKALFDLKKVTLKENELKRANSIIDNKETASYSKLTSILNSK